MIYNIRIVTNSGMLMYEKMWSKICEDMDNFSTIVPSLLTAMMKTGQSAIGMSLKYIAISGISVSIAIHSGTGISCYVFYEEKDGEEVGHYVSEAVLREFIKSYQLEDEESIKLKDFKQLQDMSIFQNFNVSIVSAIRKSIKIILQDFKKKQGVLSAEVFDHERSSSDIDLQTSGFEMLANIKTMVLLIDSMMSLKNMGNSQLNVIEFTTNRLIIQKVRMGCLAVVAQKSILPKELELEIKKYTSLINIVQTLIASLQ
ncbi:hypothetical protein ENUP19_0305G0017 [Entamoeba nuttalli]|uniref:Uncharacterized protein n=1 Tax=Entamoeba nuttalli TaxID=412467 RepID=A0ABQ0DV98_9EUKA